MINENNELIRFNIQFWTRILPGSEMMGVPASLAKATDLPNEETK